MPEPCSDSHVCCVFQEWCEISAGSVKSPSVVFALNLLSSSCVGPSSTSLSRLRVLTACSLTAGWVVNTGFWETYKRVFNFRSSALDLRLRRDSD